MSVGIPITKADVDNQSGSIARSVFNVFQTVGQFQAWLAATPDVNLTNLGFSAPEVAVLKSAFSDLNALSAIFAGGAPGSAKDYRAFAKQLIGTGLF